MPYGGICVTTRRPGSGWTTSQTMTKLRRRFQPAPKPETQVVHWERTCGHLFTLRFCTRSEEDLPEADLWVLCPNWTPHLLGVVHLTGGCLVRLSCLLSLALFRGLCSQLCVSAVETHPWAWTRSLYPNTLAEEGLNFAAQVHLCLEEILRTVQHNLKQFSPLWSMSQFV